MPSARRRVRSHRRVVVCSVSVSLAAARGHPEVARRRFLSFLDHLQLSPRQVVAVERSVDENATTTTTTTSSEASVVGAVGTKAAKEGGKEDDAVHEKSAARRRWPFTVGVGRVVPGVSPEDASSSSSPPSRFATPTPTTTFVNERWVLCRHVNTPPFDPDRDLAKRTEVVDAAALPAGAALVRVEALFLDGVDPSRLEVGRTVSVPGVGRVVATNDCPKGPRVGTRVACETLGAQTYAAINAADLEASSSFGRVLFGLDDDDVFFDFAPDAASGAAALAAYAGVADAFREWPKRKRRDAVCVVLSADGPVGVYAAQFCKLFGARAVLGCVAHSHDARLLGEEEEEEEEDDDDDVASGARRRSSSQSSSPHPLVARGIVDAVVNARQNDAEIQIEDSDGTTSSLYDRVAVGERLDALLGRLGNPGDSFPGSDGSIVAKEQGHETTRSRPHTSQQQQQHSGVDLLFDAAWGEPTASRDEAATRDAVLSRLSRDAKVVAVRGRRPSGAHAAVSDDDDDDDMACHSGRPLPGQGKKVIKGHLHGRGPASLSATELYASLVDKGASFSRAVGRRDVCMPHTFTSSAVPANNIASDDDSRRARARLPAALAALAWYRRTGRLVVHEHREFGIDAFPVALAGVLLGTVLPWSPSSSGRSVAFDGPLARRASRVARARVGAVVLDLREQREDPASGSATPKTQPHGATGAQRDDDADERRDSK